MRYYHMEGTGGCFADSLSLQVLRDMRKSFPNAFKRRHIKEIKCAPGCIFEVGPLDVPFDTVIYR